MLARSAGPVEPVLDRVRRGIRAMVDEQIESYGKPLNVDFEISLPGAVRRPLLRGSGS